jgi:hypothetical protein
LTAYVKIIEFQRTGHYDLMYVKTKELGRKPENLKFKLKKRWMKMREVLIFCTLKWKSYQGDE